MPEVINKYGQKDDPPVYVRREGVRSKEVSFHYAISYGWTVLATLAALALTAAAVVVLKERKPTA